MILLLLLAMGTSPPGIEARLTSRLDGPVTVRVRQDGNSNEFGPFVGSIAGPLVVGESDGFLIEVDRPLGGKSAFVIGRAVSRRDCGFLVLDVTASGIAWNLETAAAGSCPSKPPPTAQAKAKSIELAPRAELLDGRCFDVDIEGESRIPNHIELSLDVEPRATSMSKETWFKLLPRGGSWRITDKNELVLSWFNGLFGEIITVHPLGRYMSGVSTFFSDAGPSSKDRGVVRLRTAPCASAPKRE